MPQRGDFLVSLLRDASLGENFYFDN